MMHHLAKTAICSGGGLRRVARLALTEAAQSHRAPLHQVRSVPPRAGFSSAPDPDPGTAADEVGGSGPKADDFFDVLGVRRRFAIDEDEVRSAYRRLMGRYHPDRHTLKSAEEREELAKFASAVTRAYAVVSDAHSRAEHLLDLAGRGIAEDVNGLADGPLLMEVMELRETVDGASSDEDLQALLDENRVRVEGTCEDLADAFGANDLDAARRLTARLQYWKRIEEKILEKISAVS